MESEEEHSEEPIEKMIKKQHDASPDVKIENQSPPIQNPNKRIRKPPKIFEIPIEKKRPARQSATYQQPPQQQTYPEVDKQELTLPIEYATYEDQLYYSKLDLLRDYEIKKMEQNSMGDKKVSALSEEAMDPGRLELSMDSMEYNKGLYMPSFQHDRLTSPDASGLTFSPQAPTPQQMFGVHTLKVNITEE
jgi:hypothetical protein